MGENRVEDLRRITAEALLAEADVQEKFWDILDSVYAQAEKGETSLRLVLTESLYTNDAAATTMKKVFKVFRMKGFTVSACPFSLDYEITW